MTIREQPRVRKRARQACVVCNSRRVKCNVTESQPCRNCIAANIACEVRESRRGKRRRRTLETTVESHSQHLLQQGTPEDDERETGSPNSVSEAVNENQLPNSTDELDEDIGSALSPPRHDNPSASRDSRQEDDSAVFLGESSSLRYVHNNETPSTMVTSPPNEGLKLRFPIAHTARADSIVPDWEARRKASRIESLRNEGAFSLPSASTCDALLKSYFTWFHPCFPIVDRAAVMELYLTRTLSPLLLQAMLFVGVLHSEASVLRELGGRERARYLFYNRAKDIYDSDYESHQITVIQALFLMSFWRAGPLLEKDARHWLGAAISLAQSKAMHRSTADPCQPSAKLRKRIWWSIYVRERQCAAALGLPHRIRDEDCDLQALDLADFEQMGHIHSASTRTSEPEDHVIYVIEMVKLAQLLGRVVDIGYLPNKSMNGADLSSLKDLLAKWKRELPNNMRLDNDFGEPSNFYTNMLHLAYNNILILSYRSAFMGDSLETRRSDSPIALQAACRNSRIVEDMLSHGAIKHGQVHVITNLFNTLCIHTVHMRRSKGTARSVAEHRAKLCLIGLQELQKTWDVTNWVLQLFFQYLDNSTATRLRVMDDEPAAAAAMAMQSLSDPNSRFRTPQQQQDPSLSRPPPTIATPTDVAPAPVLTSSSWPWSAEEMDNFLFSQIQNEFAFGEGGHFGYDMESDYGVSSNFMAKGNFPSFTGLS